MKFVESAKLWSEYLKHLTTLSVGSIVLLTAFLEKLFKQPEWIFSLVISLIGFLLCVLGAVLSYTSIAISHLFWETDESPPDYVETPGIIAIICSWLSFCVGIIFLTIFAIKNII